MVSPCGGTDGGTKGQNVSGQAWNRAGIEVVGDLSLPGVARKTLDKMDDDPPVAMVWIWIIAMGQQVRVHCIEQELTVPSTLIAEMTSGQKTQHDRGC